MLETLKCNSLIKKKKKKSVKKNLKRQGLFVKTLLRERSNV